MLRKFLLASDFDQTLSFNDSGVVLSELIGFNGFHDKVAEMNLVQQGALRRILDFKVGASTVRLVHWFLVALQIVIDHVWALLDGQDSLAV